MKKKKLRKELELSLLKSIDETLEKHNTETVKGIRKIIFDTAKTIAKRFYKTVKPIPEKAVPLPEVKPLTTKGKLKSVLKSSIPVKQKTVKSLKVPVAKANKKK